MAAHGEHRTEDLVAVDLGVLGHIGQQGGQIVGAGEVRGLAAGDDAGALRRGAIDHGGHLGAVGERDQRAQIGVGVLRVADDDLAHQFGHPGDEVVVEVRGHDGAGGGGAVLAGVDQCTGHRSVHGGVEVGVVEHHERRLAAEFELGAVTLCGRGGHDPAAHRGGAGEGDDIDARVPGQRLADIRARSGDHVEHTVGQAGFLGQPGQGQRGERGQFGGLDDHRAAGGQGGDHLPHRHLQRVVPRGDGGHDADGFPADRGGVVGGVLRGGLALQVARGPGEEGDVVDTAGDVELRRQPHRFTGLADLLGHHLVRVSRQQFGQRGQHLGALRGCCAGPAGQRGAGRGHRGVDVNRLCQGQFGHYAAICRVDHLVPISAGDNRGSVDPTTRNHGRNSTHSVEYVA